MRFYKCLKIVLIFNLITNLTCLAQDSLSTSHKNEILNNYSNFIGLLQLNKVIKVQSLAYKSSFSQTGSLGTIQQKNVMVLTLAPDSSVNTPFKFAEAWNKVVSRYAPAGNIYNLLFAKLAGYTQLPPQNLVINLHINRSPAVAFMVYYDKAIKVNELAIGSRDPADYFDPGDLDDNTVGGFFNHVSKTSTLSNKLLSGLSTFFANYKHKKPIAIEQKSWADGMFYLKINNIEGEVVPRLHEIITMNIFFTPDKEAGYVNISFMFTVLCAGGTFQAPTSDSDYKDALPSYKAEVSAYGIRLKQQMRQILNAR